MKLRSALHLIALLPLAAMLTACSGGSSAPAPPPITVALTGAPNSIIAGATATLTATVSNDSANAGVTWSVTCGSTACGSFSSAATASGATTTYTAPSTVPTNSNVTVVATSVTDKTKTASAIITINATTPSITVTLTPPIPGSLVTGSTASLAATVANDTANAGVTWSVSCGSTACGTFTPTTTASGTATTYTAPSAVPTNSTVTVVATSVTDKTKSASATITITTTPPPNAILGDGTYVFHAAGYDGNSQYFVAGAFTVKSGVITGGEQDFLDTTFGKNDQISATGSGLALTADGNIQITLNTGDTSIGVNGVETFNGTAVSSARLLISESDAFASGPGSVDLQTSAAAPSGGYAFAVAGLDNQSPQRALALGGVLNFSGTSLSTSGSIFDCNDSGTPVLGQSFTSGSVSAPDTFGRVTFTLNPSSACKLFQLAFTGYIVGGNQIQLVETGSDTFNGTLGGLALGQGSNTGKFTAANVNNMTYVFSAIGEDVNGGLTLAGGFAMNPSGAVSGDLAFNDLTATGGNTITGGSFQVDPTGRVTLSNVATSGNNTTNPLTLAFQLYLDGNGNALELGVDNVQVSSGMAYLQTTGAFPSAGSSALLSQGIVPVSVNSLAYWSAAGPQTLTTNAFTGFVDYNLQGYSFTANTPVSATVNTSNGVITIGGLDINYATDGFGYYPIDSSSVLAIEVDGQQLSLLQLEGVSLSQ